MERCIEIPTADSAEVVEVYVDELRTPEEAAGVCELIASEEAPARLYLRLAKLSPDTVFPWIFEAAVSDCKLRAPSVAAELLGMQAMRVLRSNSNGLEQATALLNQAERLDNQVAELWARKGLLLLFSAANSSSSNVAQVDTAELQFKAIMEQDKESVVARVGMAMAAFCRRDYSSAADLFEAVMMIIKGNQELLRECKLAFANCCSQLLPRRYEEACRVYRELLTVNRSDRDALRGQGVLLTSPCGGLSVVGPTAVTEGLQLLKQFYTEHDRNDPIVCLLLADHFFYKRDYAKAATLASTAHSSPTASERIKARAVYLLARISHATSSFDDAFARYLQVVKLDPKHAGGNYGLSQLYCHRNDISSAIKCLEVVCEGTDNASNIEAKALLGCLLVQRYGESGELALLERAWNKCFKDLVLPSQPPIVQLAMATVLETRDPAKALEIYKDLQRDHPDLIDGRRVCNMAVLAIHLGDITMARQLLDSSSNDLLRAIIKSENESVDDPTTDQLFRHLNTRPAMLYLCHRRLIPRGDLAGAMDLFKELLGTDDRDVEAWYGMAVCHVRQRSFTPARKAFERILGTIDKHDIPALSGLAVVYVELARATAETTPRQQYLKRALEFAGKALSLEPHCMVAANAAAVALCELGVSLSVAKEVLHSISISIQKTAILSRFQIDVLSNAGLLMTELGAFEEARVCLQKAATASKSEAMQSNLQLMLARACFAQGKHGGEKHSFLLAIEHLQHALIRSDTLSTTNSTIAFNMALCYQEAALALMKSAAGVNPNMAKSMLTEAVEYVELAKNHLSSLSSSTSLDPKTIQQRLTYTASLSSLLSSRLQEAHSREQQRTAQLRSVQLERDRAKERQLQLQEEEEQRRREQLERIEEQRRQLQASIVENANTGSTGNSGSESDKPKQTKKRHKEESDGSPAKRKKQLSKDFISSSEGGESEDKTDDHDELDELFKE